MVRRETKERKEEEVMIQEIKAFLKEIRRNWEIDVLGKKPRRKNGRYAKRKNHGN